MEILKSLFRSIVRLVAINIALILFFASAPLLYVTVPFWVILTHKSVADMATDLHAHRSVRLRVLDDCRSATGKLCVWRKRRVGLENWRDSEGGMVLHGWKVHRVHGNGLVRHRHWRNFVFCGAAGNLLHSTTGRLEFFAMAPFAVFAPVWLVLLRRWMREQET